MTPPPLGTLAASGDRPAIVEPDAGSLSYGQLDRLADEIAGKLGSLGLGPQSRVGIYARRSADAIAIMLGTLRAGAAYVPVDPNAPVDRIADILADCHVQLAFVEDRFEASYRNALKRANASQAGIQPLGAVGGGKAIAAWAAARPGIRLDEASDPSPHDVDLACLLYTSGSTGRPKAWMMTRAAIEAHARWSVRFLEATRADVFANHAPFSFGMSLFDVYSSLSCGACLVLVPDQVRQHGRFLADLIERHRVTIWFSGPAALSLIAQAGDLQARDFTALRVVAFAGEVFPLPQLNALRRLVPQPRYFNFYGSTETNVAASYELAPSGDLDERPPIGRVCDHFEARVIGEDGAPAATAAPGELQLRGPGLTAGYLNPQDSTPKFADAIDGGSRWFKTSDLVVTRPSGDLRYAGRIGRMIKLRGYRVEPGEIESRLYQHESIREVGVVPAEGASGLELIAHVSTTTGARIPTVALKEFCAVKLPAYMVPARFEFHASLPKTSSGKIDLEHLRSHRVPTST